ncbi:hypothetical protein HNQ40_002532 [Algisphaera agarilytica]|uniref:Uncharacterized protein n=1 Tax=Algisphaera agarilytica TaxID=1385975 RepID=A0A7X0LLK3_9BACT|nr:hypothetical protein [Algisphaera agarilytica]
MQQSHDSSYLAIFDGGPHRRIQLSKHVPGQPRRALPQLRLIAATFSRFGGGAIPVVSPIFVPCSELL